MSTTIDSLLVKFEVSNRELKKGFEQANNEITSFSNKAKAGFAVIASAYSAAFALKGMTDVITKFEKLEASLVTVTGSSEKAAKEFEKLQHFASTTPFQLSEVVDGFIKMKALGLDPSEKALNSYGNTASAMGKSLNQMIEAVADASTGEFERLKEFGIKAKQEADNVVFTFQGVSTTIRKNADDISGYLQSIGDNQFAGAMERQADTLNVALSNMNDSFDKLIKAVGDAGLTNLLINSANSMTELTDKTRENIPVIKEWGDKILSSAPPTMLAWNLLKAWNTEQEINNALVKEGIDLKDTIASSGVSADPNAPFPVFKPEEDAAKAIEEEERKKELLQRDLEIFQQSLMTKSQLEDENYAARIEKLQVFKEQELISEQEYNNLFEHEMIRHQDKAEEIRKQGLSRLEKFQEMSYKDQAKTVFGQLESITAGVAQHNRALFEANKVAGIANAIVSAYEGISKTMGSYPFPINVGMAAAHAAAAFAQVNAIRSTSFGGGGGAAPSVSGSTPAPPVTPTSGGGSGSAGGSSGGGGVSNVLDLVISGITEEELYSGRQIDNIIRGINERIADGASLGSLRLS